jgi:hypothetical protein
MLGYKNRYQKWLDTETLTTEVNESIYEAVDINPKAKPKLIKKSVVIPDLNQEDSNVDWDTRNRKNRLKGAAAEEHVLKYEEERLTALGREDLAAKIEDYSKKLGQGFDILSFNEDGTHRKIEVKSTSKNSFIITANELEKSQQENFCIYLVTELKEKVKVRRISSPDLNNDTLFTLTPQQFEVSFLTE